VARYLSLAWIEELSQEVAGDPAVSALSEGLTIGITQVVTKGPEGTIVYHLQVDDGSVIFGPGLADPEDVRFEQTWKTAVGVATGTLAAQEAFLKGLIKLQGDKDKLVANQPVLAALEPVFGRVREHTDYA
jgi:SCP-2 sterol transfer family